MISLFWMSFLGAFYAYFGYPILLLVLGKLKVQILSVKNVSFSENDAPSITMIIPAHNEESIIGDKLRNTLSLYYPGKLQILVVSDGSTDNTVRIVNNFLDSPRITLFELKKRKGKAQALNQALEQVEGDIVVFSDASIMLEQNALWHIVQPFTNPKIGCVSGEDLIEDGGGEGLYGKYELFLRNQESTIGSIVGASGSFYAQRTALIDPFLEGLAPDFLSVMNTVEKGYRVISYPAARGKMTSVKSSRDEFKRKVRTLIRGMTALFRKTNLLNPVRYPVFAFFLWSHKIMRWLVPFFLMAMLISSLLLFDNIFYKIILLLQLLFYFLAFLGAIGISRIAETLPGKVALYFTSVNIAIVIAWVSYALGVRQEIWTPSKRS